MCVLLCLAMPAAADASAASPQAPQTDAEPAAPECIAICEQEAVDRDLERLIIRGDALLQQSLQREDQRAARIEVFISFLNYYYKKRKSDGNLIKFNHI